MVKAEEESRIEDYLFPIQTRDGAVIDHMNDNTRLLKEILWQLISLRREQREHWKEMHNPELDKERENMIKQLIGNMDVITKPFKSEQEEWDRKLGRDKK